MALIDDKTGKAVKEVMAAMADPIHILVFTGLDECRSCSETVQMIEELGSLTGKITHERLVLEDNEGLAGEMGIDKTPAVVVNRGTPEDNKYLGVRFFGIPAGYEFTSLLDSIVSASTGVLKISDETREYLAGLEKDLHIKVFVTPTCPYCPPAVVLAHHMAMASDRVVAEMIEASEFPEEARKFNVMGVPRTVINGKVHQEGAAPERLIVEKIRQALG